MKHLTALLTRGRAEEGLGVETENARPSRRRRAHGARHGGVLVALILMTLVVGALATPAGANAAAGGRWRTTQIGRSGVVDAAPGSGAGDGRAGALDVLMAATLGTSALVLALVLAHRPHLARRRTVQRFRSQLRDCDLASLLEPANSDDLRIRGQSGQPEMVPGDEEPPGGRHGASGCPVQGARPVPPVQSSTSTRWWRRAASGAHAERGRDRTGQAQPVEHDPGPLTPGTRRSPWP